MGVLRSGLATIALASAVASAQAQAPSATEPASDSQASPPTPDTRPVASAAQVAEALRASPATAVGAAVPALAGGTSHEAKFAVAIKPGVLRDMEEVLDQWKHLTVSGRVFARAEYARDRQEPWAGGLSLASARMGVNYERKAVRMRLTMEARSSVKVRNAFAELRFGDVHVRAGRFKVPIGEVQRASSWDLPTIGRGGIAAALEDGLALTGRRIGVAVMWRASQLPLTLGATVHQSQTTAGDDLYRPLSDGGGLGAVVNVEYKARKRLAITAFASNRELRYGNAVERFWASGLGARLSKKRVAAWLDAIAGTAHWGDATGPARSGFWAVQTIWAYKVGSKKAKPSAIYVMPFVNVGMMDPTRALSNDLVVDVSAGAVLGGGANWRVQVQGSFRTAGAARPSALAGLDTDLNDNIGVATQLGVAF